MQKKRAFTLIEIIVVVSLLWLIIWFTKNFLNTTRQERILFGENCINYIFWQIEKVQSDINYERNNNLLMTGGKSPWYFGFTYDWQLSGNDIENWEIRVFGIGRTWAVDNNGFGVFEKKEYVHIPLTTNNSTNIPTQCQNKRFTVVIDSPDNSLWTHIVIPTKESDPDTNWYIWDDWERGIDQNYPGNSTGEAKFFACDKNTPWYVRNCIEIAKTYADKRSKQFYYWKCINTNPDTGKCQLRPSTN